jgi:large conductance mechanosensitive channel
MAESPQQIKEDQSIETVQVTIPKHHRASFASLLEALDADDVVEQHVHGFANFLREYSVVGLAVGFVAGSQVAVVVKQLVSSFVDPLFVLLVGKTLTSRTFTLHWHGRHANFGWGSFVYALLDFIFILITIYAAIKLFKLDRFQKQEVKVDPKNAEVSQKK